MNSHVVDKELKEISISWGYTSNPGHAASNLQWIVVKIVGNEACKERMTSTNAEKVYETSLCAEPAEVGGACK